MSIEDKVAEFLSKITNGTLTDVEAYLTRLNLAVIRARNHIAEKVLEYAQLFHDECHRRLDQWIADQSASGAVPDERAKLEHAKLVWKTLRLENSSVDNAFDFKRLLGVQRHIWTQSEKDLEIQRLQTKIDKLVADIVKEEKIKDEVGRKLQSGTIPQDKVDMILQQCEKKTY